MPRAEPGPHPDPESSTGPSPVELVRRFGTPLYLYRADRLRRSADHLRSVLPRPHRLYYSLKANPHPAVVGELLTAGLRAEVSSTGELDVALAAGQAADHILYTGPGKTDREVSYAIRAGVRLFSVESVADHHRLDEAAQACGTPVDYVVRVNGTRPATGGGLRMTGHASQFGIDVDALAAAPHLFTGTAVTRPIGLHFFPATNVPDEAALVQEFANSIRVAADILRRTGLDAELVDLGGGFAAPFARPGSAPRYDTLRSELEGLLDAGLPGWRGGRPAVAFESGRYLAGGAGTLLSTVLDVKRSGDRTFVVLDAGINALGGIAATGRLLPPSAQPSGPAADGAVTLVGPLCTPLDIVSRAASVAEPRIGDAVAIPNVGAYGLTASVVAFLSREPPREVVLDADGTVLSLTALTFRTVDVARDDRGAGAPAEFTGDARAGGAPPRVR